MLLTQDTPKTDFVNSCGCHLTPAVLKPEEQFHAKVRDIAETWKQLSVGTLTDVIALDLEDQKTQQLQDLLTEHTWLTEEIMDAEDRGKDASNDRLERRLIGEQIEELRSEV